MFNVNSGTIEFALQTRLDDVLYPEFDRESAPGEVRADSATFFKQRDFDRRVVVYEEYQPIGLPPEHLEEQPVEEAQVRLANETSKTIQDFVYDLPVSRSAFMDDIQGVVDESVRQAARKQRQKRDRNAFEKTYGDAFSGATTPDAAALVSASHVALDGSTIDNLETGALNADNAATLIKVLQLQKDQNGDHGGHEPVGGLFPRALWPNAVVVFDSELKPGTGNNDDNYLSNKYPGFNLGSSSYLDSTYNSLNSNANTSYFFVSDNHHILRYTREGLSSDVKPPIYDDKDRYIYRFRFRETAFPGTWEGMAGSNGTA